MSQDPIAHSPNKVTAGPQHTTDTRAIIKATNLTEVEAWAGARSLDLGDQQQANLFTQTLQQGKRRRKLSSSIVNFESDRTVRNIQPLPFSWEHMVDPEDEPIGWDLTFGFMRDRFQDTLHSMFRMIEAQKQGIATRAIELRRKGQSEMRLDFQDPMQPFKEMFSRLLAPKELVDPSARAQTLQYVHNGQTFDISELSSGEREVVNIAFDFLLRSPEDRIIFFDESELHLHPELSYRLLQALQEIGHHNQFIFATHSPDIISASLDRSVIFVSPPRQASDGEPENQAVAVQESDETNRTYTHREPRSSRPSGTAQWRRSTSPRHSPCAQGDHYDHLRPLPTGNSHHHPALARTVEEYLSWSKGLPPRPALSGSGFW